jgi:hypothetical protein
LTEVLTAAEPRPVTLGGRAQRIADAILGGRAPDFDAEQLPAWLNAADWLSEHGELVGAKLALEIIDQGQPGLEWVANLLDLLERAPPPDPERPDFHDDVAKDVQLQARPGAEVALMLFCGPRHRLGMPMPLIHRWLARLGVSLIYLRDFNGHCYLKGVASLGADRPATIAALRRTLDGLGARRVICLGCSGGGFGALLYALELGGDGISMGSPVNMEPEFNRHMNHAATAEQLKAAFPDEDLDLRRRIEAAARPPRTLIVFGERNWNERIHAQQAEGLPGAELYPVAGYKGHATIVELIRRGELDPMLSAFVAGRPAPPPEPVDG